MISGSDIPRCFSEGLTKDQIEILFNVTELQYDWFKEYYPNIKVNFSKLLKRNHSKIDYYISVDLFEEFEESKVTDKLNKMKRAYISLYEISKLNREKVILKV